MFNAKAVKGHCYAEVELAITADPFAEDGSQDSPHSSNAANAVYEKYDEDEEDDNYQQELDEIPQAQ